MAGINTPGWDGLDFDEHDPDLIDELDIAFRQTFGTVQGSTVLEYLKRRTLDQPSWIPGQPADMGPYREGQNSVIREIIARIARGDIENVRH